jgi:hypothetical protein
MCSHNTIPITLDQDLRESKNGNGVTRPKRDHGDMEGKRGNRITCVLLQTNAHMLHVTLCRV